MLDPKFIRENTDKVRKNTVERNMDGNIVDQWVKVDDEKLSILQKLEDIRQQKNQLQDMAKSGTPVEEIRERGKGLREAEKEINDQMEEIDKKWQDLINQIPNIHSENTPVGKDESGNLVVREIGEKPKFDFEPKDHLTIGEELGILDFESGAKVAGSQFYFLKGDGALLELALLNYGMQFLAKRGFMPTITPDMARSRFYEGTGYAPRGDEAQTYEIKGEDLGLIATSEVTMAAMHADDVLPQDELPYKFAAVSHCYRKEAGAYGKYSRGLYRVHQFTKLEMFIYCLPEHSDKMNLELLQIEEEITQSLGIPYQVLEMCTGDLGAMAARKFDLEAWMPGRGEYGEITSTSNCTDYQARNLNIKFKADTGKNEYVHMLNGTALAMSRIPIAIIENYQQADGTVKVPEVLIPFIGKEVIGKASIR